MDWDTRARLMTLAFKLKNELEHLVNDLQVNHDPDLLTLREKWDDLLAALQRERKRD